ncbi:MAG: hypothetical protein U0441_13420 [Polyangiaceae bacterium]
MIGRDRSAAIALVCSLFVTSGCGPSRSSGAAPSSSTTTAASAVATQAPTAAPTIAPDPSGAPSAAPADPDEDLRASKGLPAEPERRTLKSVADEAAIDKNRDFVADHYGVVNLPFPLQLQAMKLAEGRRALLLTGQGPALDKPLVLVVDAANALLWSKPRPLAGTHEQAKEITISRGPHGQVYLFLYDEPSKVLAGRAWTREGGIFADFQVLTAEGCDATTVHYQPGLGWVTALVHEGRLFVQILGENGTLKWPGNGVLVEAPPGGAAASRGLRPKVDVASTGVVEITLGSRRARVSAEGAVLK